MATTKTIVSVFNAYHAVKIERQRSKVAFTSYVPGETILRIVWVGDDGNDYVKYNGSFWKLNYDLVVPFIVSEFKEVEEEPTETICGDVFEAMSAEQAWDWYNWGGDLDDTKPVYRRAYAANSELYEVFIGNDKGIYSEDGDWCCEITESGCTYAQGWGKTPEEAMLAAYADARLADAMEEGNCEDAVNVCAYSAFEELRQRKCDVCSADDTHTLDELLGIARRLVKRRCEEYGDFEWQEF